MRGERERDSEILKRGALVPVFEVSKVTSRQWGRVLAAPGCELRADTEVGTAYTWWGTLTF